MLETSCLCHERFAPFLYQRPTSQTRLDERTMSISPTEVMIWGDGKTEFIIPHSWLYITSFYWNWVLITLICGCVHVHHMCVSVICSLWVHVDCKCVRMGACTFHKCILQDVYASLNSVEIPPPLACTVNIYAGAIFSLHIDTAWRHDFRLLCPSHLSFLPVSLCMSNCFRR